MNIKTNLITLKNAYNILSEIEVEGLLTGEATKINLKNLADHLFKEDKLEDFIVCITGNQDRDSIRELELKEAVDLIQSFFTAIRNAFPGSVNMQLTNGK